jgi:hypothetical protein
MFVMPWSYVIGELECESEERSRPWEEEKNKDFDSRNIIDNLNKKRDKKQTKFLSVMHRMLQKAGNGQHQVYFTYAAQVMQLVAEVTTLVVSEINRIVDRDREFILPFLKVQCGLLGQTVQLIGQSGGAGHLL